MVVDGKVVPRPASPITRRGLVLSGVPATPGAGGSDDRPGRLLRGDGQPRGAGVWGGGDTPDHSKALAIQGLGRDDRACRRSAIRRLTLSAVRATPPIGDQLDAAMKLAAALQVAGVPLPDEVARWIDPVQGSEA